MYIGNVVDVYWEFFVDVYWECGRCVLGMWSMCIGNVVDVYWECGRCVVGDNGYHEMNQGIVCQIYYCK